MNSRMQEKPRIGAVAMAYPDNGLGEGMCQEQIPMLRDMLARRGAEAIIYPNAVLLDNDARAAGEMFARENADVLLVLLTTFIPDYFLVELLDGCDRPVFLWS